MWWANDAALKLWGADTLESLLARDFASDMSQATERRINSYLDRFRKDERFSEQVRACRLRSSLCTILGRLTFSPRFSLSS